MTDKPIDWRAHSAQFARGEKTPNTLETAQAACITATTCLALDGDKKVSKTALTLYTLRHNAL